MDELKFDLPTDDSQKIIKVIGVGGGGGNAVNHMLNVGDIHAVTYLLCNTDAQALGSSNCKQQLQLGPKITHGLGAGAKPEIAEKAAVESEMDIRHALADGTKMVFITAGMGGGTGTGAAPIIAKIAKSMDILTVGIVTIPFLFEGMSKIIQALDGVDQICQNVDALLVINNEKLRSVYPDLTFSNAFALADDMLLNAVKSIADIITMPKKINLDFADVSTTLKDGGVAIMATGEASGDGRVTKAIDEALTSPLLSNKAIYNSKRVLLCVSFSPEHELIMDEINEITSFTHNFQAGIEVIWGGGPDETLKDSVKITILATGFEVVDALGDKELEEKYESKKNEKLENNKKRIAVWYGADARTDVRHRYVYLYSQAALDNDDLIAKVDSSPVYNRDKKTLNSIQNFIKEESAATTVSQPSKEADKTDDGPTVITFG
jgi:cell division protein FtsZ